MAKVTQTAILELDDKEFRVLYTVFDKLANYGDLYQKIGMLPEEFPTIQQIWDDLNVKSEEI